jgi:hypothetical protein
MRYANGDEYNGEWIDGVKHGFGVYTMSDKSKYEGSWVNDDREGFGEFTNTNGDLYRGLY